jgi:hypothetical protein
MADYPQQEIKTGQSKRATIAKRDRITMHADAASGGSSNPAYTSLIAASVPAEILQVSGGEFIRGKQVESNTQYVVSIDYLPSITVDAECQITVLTGVYNGLILHIHRVHFETERARPVNLQLHCRTRS